MNAEILEGYSNHVGASLPRSMRDYRSLARTFLRWLALKNISLAQLTPQQINDYLCCRISSGRRASTVQADLAGLRRLLRYARQQGLVAHNPAMAVSYRWLRVPGGYPGYRGALTEALSLRPSSLFSYRLPLFAPDWEGFLKHLIDQGYSRPTVRNIALRNRHFHRYLTATKVRRIEQIRPAHLDAFIARVGWRFQRRHGRPPRRQFLNPFRRALTLFLDYAFSRRCRTFRRTKTTSKSRALPDNLLQRYLEFCRSHKGLRPSTLQGHLYVLKKLRRFLGRRRIKRIEAVSLSDYDAFLLNCSKSVGPRFLFSVLSVLRGFLRYLYLEGTIPSDLGRALVSPCRFSADLRPKYLPWRKIEHLLAGIERDTLVGKRDHAILTLLACHGLRACEVAKLTRSDIDWKAPSLLLRDQKNGSTSQIPLSPQAKEALERYLAVRPDCAHPEIFLTAQAPIRPLGIHLSCVAHQRLKRCFGRLLPTQGSRLLRHSFAKMLLDRKAPLQDVALLFRHRSPNSIQAYTRIAIEDLREVADNYATLLAGRHDDDASSAEAPAT